MIPKQLFSMLNSEGNNVEIYTTLQSLAEMWCWAEWSSLFYQKASTDNQLGPARISLYFACCMKPVIRVRFRFICNGLS
jgi:hypothetical protein